jgi:hypothetical protein
VAAAIAYLYTPYLLVNLYVRGAAAELLAQALLPWLFWSTTRVFTAATPVRYVVVTSMLLGAVALGHNITLLLLPAVLGAYVLLLLALHRANAATRRGAWRSLPSVRSLPPASRPFSGCHSLASAVCSRTAPSTHLC